MKRTIQLTTSFLCLVLGGVATHAAMSYWDTTGATPGAGDTPNGTWDAGATWSASASGSVATTPWTDGNTAVFSAGSDGTNAFTVTVTSTVNPSGITFEEGLATITGGTISITNADDFPIIANTNASILSSLSGGGFKKTGPGTLTLGADNNTSGQYGLNTVAEGILALTMGTALGDTTTPTIVSNGASLELSTTIAFPEPVVLNGFGVSNRGALYGYVGGSGASTGARAGGAVINSDARINHYGTTGTWWNWTTQVIVTNGVNSADLYIGGNGNTLRLNINVDYPGNPGYRRPCFDIGAGVLYKDGSVELRLENSNIAREVRFNEGHILSRCGPGTNFCYRTVVPGLFYCTEGAFWSSGDYVPATIYVGPNAGQFRNGTTGPSQHWQHPIELAAGANPVFRPQSFPDAYIICEGLISGVGGLSKFNDSGALYLNTNNTYSGNTTIRGGFLTLGANGSISNSAVIDVWTNGTFNVTSNAGGFVLGATQTLRGNGTVLGNVTAAGTISPGSSVGNLTNNGNLTLAAGAKLFIEVDKSGTPSNDVVVVIGALSAGSGTLTVTNLNPGVPLAAGDTFAVFKDDLGNGKAVSGGGSLTIVSAEGGVTWNNNLAANGTISVDSVAPPALPPTHARITSISGAGTTSVTVNYTNTIPGTNYTLSYSTNLSTPNWYTSGNKIAPGTIDAQTDSPPAGSPRRYYRVYYYRP